MTQREKLIERLRAARAGAPFADVDRLLVDAGWSRARQRGSHMTYTKSGEIPITVALVHGRRIKQTYLKIVLQRLGLED